MKLSEFIVVFNILADYFNANPSPGVTKLYYEFFKNWPIEKFKKACNLICQTRTYNGLPKIAEIVEILEGNNEEKVTIAYQMLMEAIRKYGPWETVIFEDGAIGRAVEALGGWEIVNDWTFEEWKYRKKDFEKLYLANLRLGKIEPKLLYGAFDRINGFMGQKGFNKPILIKKCEFLNEKEKSLIYIEKKDESIN